MRFLSYNGISGKLQIVLEHPKNSIKKNLTPDFKFLITEIVGDRVPDPFTDQIDAAPHTAIISSHAAAGNFMTLSLLCVFAKQASEPYGSRYFFSIDYCFN